MGPGTTNVQRGLAFAAGVSFAVLPAIGPFLAVLVFLTGRLEIQRADVWWWLAAALLGFPYILTGHLAEGALTMMQLVAVWLIFRSATVFRRGVNARAMSTAMGAGLVVGLGVTLILGLRHLAGFQFDAAITTLDAIVWNTHPALFGHAVLVLSALLAIVVPSPRLRVVALAIGAVGVVFSGAREAVWAWLAIAVGLRVVRRRGSRGTSLAEWALIALMAFMISGLAATLGLGRTGFLTDYLPQPAGENLFRGTEVGQGDWWFPLGVKYKTTDSTTDQKHRTTFTVTKEWAEPWSRLQQAVTLVPGTTYTLSALIEAPPGASVGFDGWGRVSNDDDPVNLATVLTNQTHDATVSGPLELVSSSMVADRGDSRRAFVTFRYEGTAPVTWYVGVVPDRSARTGTTISFSELQLTSSYSLLPYRPGPAARGVTDIRNSRFPIWRDALQAIRSRPLLGWGPNGFVTAVNTLHPDEALLRPVASHAHNALLAAWVDRGILGVLGLVGLFAVLALRAVQQRDRAAVVVLVGVLILNLFDSTLLSGAIIYPLAAVLGWRAVGSREAAQSETGVGSAAAVRSALAFSDALAGAIALSLGLAVASWFDPNISVVSSWSSPLAYMTLIWPAVAAGSGLYPGYGRPSHQELSRSVRAAAFASVLVGFIALLVPDLFGLSAPVFIVAVPFAAILAPLLRALTKFALRHLRLWGRPVVMLGTGAAASRVARHLITHPGVGLNPVAAFGDGGTWGITQLPVTGPLEEAWNHIRTHRFRHAIVTPEAATSAAFDQVLLRSANHLKYVQYLPDLRGLPTHSVVAAQLGTSLALEARNQLASGTNRAVKRAIDLIGSALLLAILGAPLLLLALIIRLDSRGPALYLSPRIGRNGRAFHCIKFRTMHQDAEARLTGLLQERPDLRAEYETFHKLENDPRVTRVGRVLRRLSLDELPQLLNVIAGQMSLVGPRPYMEREREIMGAERDLIFLARPGMTGYWQIEARNDVTFEERQTMEAHYVRNWSVWWDIDILLRTPGVMVAKTGK